jgi:hypothetical protein
LKDILLTIKNKRFMTLTIQYIESAFNKYNVLYFNGLLRKPVFKITNSKNRLGTLAIKISPFGAKSHTLSVSKYYDRTEKQYDNTIIHEMIHLYISQNNIIDNGSHGRRFKAECARINKYGWNLSRTTSTSDWKLSNEATEREEKRLANASYSIIIYKEDSGTQFIFRVAKGNENKFYNYLKDRCKLECKLFESNDPIFDKLPSCRSRVRGRRGT